MELQSYVVSRNVSPAHLLSAVLVDGQELLVVVLLSARRLHAKVGEDEAPLEGALVVGVDALLNLGGGGRESRRNHDAFSNSSDVP